MRKKYVKLLELKQNKTSLEISQEKFFSHCILNALSSHLWKRHFELKVDALTFFVCFKKTIFVNGKKGIFFSTLSLELKRCYITVDNVALTISADFIDLRDQLLSMIYLIYGVRSSEKLRILLDSFN